MKLSGIMIGISDKAQIRLWRKAKFCGYILGSMLVCGSSAVLVSNKHIKQDDKKS